MKSYSKKYFQSVENGSIPSAKEILPIIQKMLAPHSVVDIGCGTGAWLREWNSLGIQDILGIDHNYIKKEQLLIPSKNFQSADLEKDFKACRPFDLVMCLEVAEHLRPNFDKSFIKSICQFGKIILFSAAVPGQGGLNHFNEQYPEYWAKIFKENSYYPIDCIREQIWMNDRIELCYRQNLILFIHKEEINNHLHLPNHLKPLLPLIHPGYFDDKVKEIQFLKKILHNPASILKYYIKALLKRIHRITTQ